MNDNIRYRERGISDRYTSYSNRGAPEKTRVPHEGHDYLYIGHFKEGYTLIEKIKTVFDRLFNQKLGFFASFDLPEKIVAVYRPTKEIVREKIKDLNSNELYKFLVENKIKANDPLFLKIIPQRPDGVPTDLAEDFKTIRLQRIRAK